MKRGQFIKTINHTQIIQLLIDKNNYSSYCEIGCDRDHNFKNINCKNKTGIDPKRGGTLRVTSDDFFKDNKMFFDIFFIDGLHWAEQVYKDIINSLFFLSRDGVVVVHDCNPLNYNSQIVPQPKRQRHWNGSVWRGWLKLRCKREDLEMFTIDADEGCGIIIKGKQELIKEWDITYEQFIKNKKELLNLISLEEFERKLYEK